VLFRSRERWFQQSGEGFVLDRRLAASARFERHNLVETPYPFPDVGPAFDVIVCRNVLIYFTAEAAERTVGLLAERLGDGGTLVLSAAEPILKPRPELETLRVGGTFFYRPRRAPVSEAPSPPTHQPPVPPPRPSAPVPVDPQRFTPRSPVDEGVELFSLVLEWSAAGQADEETAAGLRKALYLAPDLAAARYCLGLLLEQQGRRADATTEYRRAVASLEAGRAPPTAFFLNVERLERACRVALDRLTRS
jgi:chemotaxis protein methyltransferase CheR